MSHYPLPVITADIIVYKLCPLEVLFIKRNKDPFKDCWAFPGGHFNPEDFLEAGVIQKADPSILFAAQRELREETGLLIEDENRFSFVKYYDRIGRDKRGRYVTFAFSVEISLKESEKIKAADDASDYRWFDMTEGGTNEKFAFDHGEILSDWLARNEAWSNLEIAREVLSESFENYVAKLSR